ncbi:putative Alpha/beta hydrolase fold protein [Seiridium cardinale]|uniref:Alpha/beta hydrolase fold protein n=1 Tax=Seiridium cardinale TaxID=138064 RepID=A0ABR2X913_9PEZI
MATETAVVQAQAPVATRLYNGFTIYGVQGITSPIRWMRAWNEWMWPSGFAPNIVKTYDARPSLPIRIFFPKNYDQTSPESLPMVFSIHGGGFCIGAAEDDDRWNRQFADTHELLVVELNYRKAPWYPFPTAVHDLEALMLAAFADESLPIDKGRVAITGFSAGGNLALSVAQLPNIRETIKPSALLPIYPAVDQSIPSGERAKRRHYKPELVPGIRGSPVDMLARFSPIFKWSYVNPGQDLRDPLLSPFYAEPGSLPPNVYFVAAELDQLAHEGWRMACKLSGRPVPEPEDLVGQAKTAPKDGELILDNERFAWQHDTPSGSVRWLLVPDQIHGFDHVPPRWYGHLGSWEDAQVKTGKYQALLGEWLLQVVWKNSASRSE